MRTARLKGEGHHFVHTLSRVVDRRFIFGDAEKEHFVKLMRKLSAFHQIPVVTFCVMSNHFHLLLEQPDPELVPDLTKDELLRRLPLLYKDSTVREIKEELDRLENSGDLEAVGRFLEPEIINPSPKRSPPSEAPVPKRSPRPPSEAPVPKRSPPKRSSAQAKPNKPLI